MQYVGPMHICTMSFARRQQRTLHVHTPWMHLSFNFVNVYTRFVKV